MMTVLETTTVLGLGDDSPRGLMMMTTLRLDNDDSPRA